MTPQRKEEIRHKLKCADVWDNSKMEFHRMLDEAMRYIDELEKQNGIVDNSVEFLEKALKIGLWALKTNCVSCVNQCKNAYKDSRDGIDSCLCGRSICRKVALKPADACDCCWQLYKIGHKEEYVKAMEFFNNRALCNECMDELMND